MIARHKHTFPGTLSVILVPVSLFIGAAAIFTMTGKIAFAAPPLVLNTAQTFPRSMPDGNGFQDLIIKEACRRAGVDVEIVHLTSERSLVNADEGIDDGVFVRVAGLEEKYPNLVIVPEPITNFEFAVFTKKIDAKLANWDDLQPYCVGIIRGWKILEHNLSGVKSLIIVKDETSLFSMLEEDRLDLIVYDKLQGRTLIKRNKRKDIRIIEPPLIIKPMYLYLNKKHRELVPGLAAALREMRATGVIEGLTSKATEGLTR
jgi:polar amino acid transport system substrate-binding protein